MYICIYLSIYPSRSLSIILVLFVLFEGVPRKLPRAPGPGQGQEAVNWPEVASTGLAGSEGRRSEDVVHDQGSLKEFGAYIYIYIYICI